MPISSRDSAVTDHQTSFRDRLARRPVRRALVLAQVAFAGLIAAAIYAAGDQVALVALANVPFWACAYLIERSTLGVFSSRDGELDERLRGERDRAYKATYEVAMVALIIVVVATWIVGLALRATFAIGAGAFLLSAFAPRLVYAWRAPDSTGDAE